MTKQTWFPIWSGGWQVAQHAIDSSLLSIVLDQVEDGGMSILSFAWVKIEVEVTNAFT